MQKNYKEVIDYVRDRNLSDVDSVKYISENLGIDVDESYDLYKEQVLHDYRTDEEINEELRKIANSLPVASHFNEYGMTVAPASWREK